MEDAALAIGGLVVAAVGVALEIALGAAIVNGARPVLTRPREVAAGVTVIAPDDARPVGL